jgi:branched-chain amino acid transport system ATP-binding protein
VCYGHIEAVRDASLHVRGGEIVALVGANGAGKSTLLKALHGVVQATGGSMKLGGEELSRIPTERRVAMGLALVPEGRHVFAGLSTADNLELGLAGGGNFEQLRETVFARFPRLAERRWQKAGTLSGGEQQMLAIGRAMMSQPKLMMLDEPTLGLAPIIIRQVGELLVSLRDEGFSILLAEQNVRVALTVSDRAYVLRNGEIVDEGASRTLRQSEAIQRAYLGA